MKEKTILEYCTGCGVCSSFNHADLMLNDQGFNLANPKSEDFLRFCNQVCFASGMQYKNYKNSTFWGNVKLSVRSWALDSKVRHSASSGGTLTALCIYLLEEGIVDGIVHTTVDPENPIRTITVCSRTRHDVEMRCGSRYSSSSPLKDIAQFINTKEKYCYVGKPCDVATMRNLAKLDSNIKSCFPIMLSFFCAGAPSEKANLQLLDKLGTSLKKCVSLRYRGDGWPGYATAIDEDGSTHKLYYRNAWRDTLGRDIRNICRFCIDGIGEMADIVCYDAWYMNSDKEPIFDEAEGRNGVLCRNEIGVKILKDAENKGYIFVEDYPEYEEELPHFQAYQYTRRATMASTMLAMKTMRRNIPSYPFSFVMHMMKFGTLRTQISRYKGTIKRVLNGKI